MFSEHSGPKFDGQWVFDTTTTTIIDSTTGSTLNYEHAGETVDIVVQKAGFIPQRSVGVVLAGTFTIDFTLIADLNYSSYSTKTMLS